MKILFISYADYFRGNFDKTIEGEVILDQNAIQDILEKLKDGTISEYLVKKDDFLPFREVLVKRSDFKHFRGIGQRGGDVMYQYQEVPRS